MQDAVVDMDPISLIITSLEVKGAFPNTPHRRLSAIWEHMASMARILATRCPRLTGISGLGTLFNNGACDELPHASPLRRLGPSTKKWVRNALYSSTGDLSPESDNCPYPPPSLLFLRFCYHKQVMCRLPSCNRRPLLLALPHKRCLRKQP